MPPSPSRADEDDDSVSLSVDCGENGRQELVLSAKSSVAEAVSALLSSLEAPHGCTGDLLGNGAVLNAEKLIGDLSGDEFLSLVRHAPGKAPSAVHRAVQGRRLSLMSSGKRASVRGKALDSGSYAVHAIFLQVIMPDRTPVLLKCLKEDSLETVKLRAVEMFLKSLEKAQAALGRYELQSANKEKLGTLMSVGEVAYVSGRRSNSLTPSFILIELPSASTLAKLADKEVGALVGRPMRWTGGDGEVEMFRRVMRGVRRQERVSSVEKAVLDSSLGPIEHTEFMINVFLPELMGGVKKTLKTSTLDTGDDVRKRVFDKHYAPLENMQNKTHSDFILKIVGFNDFVDGSEIMLEHEFLMKGVYQGEKPLLKLIERQPVASEPDEDEWDPTEDPIVGTIVYSHASLSGKVLPWDQMTVISIWDVTRLLRVRIVGIDGLTAAANSRLHSLLEGDSLDEANMRLSVSAGVYHGGVPIRECVETATVPASPHPRWNKTHLQFDRLMLANLARAARLCITVYAHVGSRKVAIGWVNLQLFDYKHELRQGMVGLSLWADDEANPIGTCVPNPHTAAPSIYLELDSYALPVIFPTESLSSAALDEAAGAAGLSLASGGGDKLPSSGSMSSFSESSLGQVAAHRISNLSDLIGCDSLYQLNSEDCAVIWKFREKVVQMGKGLPKLIVSCPYDNFRAVQELHRIVNCWPPMGPLDALELLDARYADSHVRSYAVARLEMFTDSQLADYLLQLTQVLKYEPYHDSALGRFLIRRALRSSRIGHIFYWYLKAEMHVPEIAERYGLLLEAYLRGVPNFRKELTKQTTMLSILEETARAIKDKSVQNSDRLEVMAMGLKKLKFPEPLQLPLSPMFKVSSINIPKCRFMDSKKLPLWLGFVNADRDGQELKVIFKEGDDLRQDMLTLQMLRIMDRMWRNHGLDMQMSPYGCISTGNEVGFIEVVLNADTTASISREAGGARAAFQEDPLAKWLQVHNPTPQAYAQAQKRFMHSLAGYCVATYVLGIGDRHNDNIMVTRSGRLFHIDFGHFLGNFKTKFGIKRERAPFVLTPDFAYVLGGKGSAEFREFITLSCKAYNVVRKHANLFLNLFSMMLSTGIPELMRLSDIYYLRDAFSTDLDDVAAAKKFETLIFESLSTITTMVNNSVHILVHN